MPAGTHERRGRIAHTGGVHVEPVKAGRQICDFDPDLHEVVRLSEAHGTHLVPRLVVEGRGCSVLLPGPCPGETGCRQPNHERQGYCEDELPSHTHAPPLTWLPSFHSNTSSPKSSLRRGSPRLFTILYPQAG